MINTHEWPCAPASAGAVPIRHPAHYLFRAVSHARWQLGSDDQLIVRDDGSADLADYGGVKPWPDHPTRLSNPECRGVAFSRNRAFGVAKTDWIKLRDADEVLAPFALERVRPAEPPVPARLHVPAGGCHRIVDGLPTRDCLHQPYYATPFPENGDRGRVSDVSTPESKK